MKMGAFPVLAIGFALFLIFLGFGLKEYIPNTEDAKLRSDVATQYEGEAAKLGAAKKRLETAKQIVQSKADEWQKVVAVRTPPESLPIGLNMEKNAWQLTVDAQKFRDAVQTAINRQVKVGGVKVINGPAIPAPAESGSSIVANYFNYPAIPFPVVIFDLGTVTVQGTYQQITANVRSWATMPNYLTVADGLAFTGTSPVLTGTYNLTMVGYIRGKKIYPVVPEGSASGTGATGGPPTGSGGPGLPSRGANK